MDNFKAVYQILSTPEKAMDCSEFDIAQISAEHPCMMKANCRKYAYAKALRVHAER